jgi:CBS-domain-containing membrane protein
VADLARDDVVDCRLEDRAGEVRSRIEASPYPFALVLGERRVVLGRVTKSGLDCGAEEKIEHRMDPGPSTVRPHKTAESIANDLAERDLRWAIVTSPEGELIGVSARADLEAAVSAQR